MVPQGAGVGLRDRLVLGPVFPLLPEDEEISAWAHVHAPDGGEHGVIVVTRSRCVVHWSPQEPAVVVARQELTAWDVEAANGGPVLKLEAASGEVAVRLPASSKTRVRKARAVLHAISGLAPHRRGRHATAAMEVRLERRGVLGHMRRVAATVLGGLLILVGVLFASPFLPGPGLLTILAGLAVLATEYDWARDLHRWLKQKAERLRQRIHDRRRRRTRERSGVRPG